MTTSEDIPKKDVNIPSKNERTWGMLCHISTFTGMIIPFGNILSPLIIWLIKKDESLFITDQGKIIPAHVTGVSAKYQRLIANEIKKARVLALLPFVVDPRQN